MMTDKIIIQKAKVFADELKATRVSYSTRRGQQNTELDDNIVKSVIASLLGQYARQQRGVAELDKQSQDKLKKDFKTLLNGLTQSGIAKRSNSYTPQYAALKGLLTQKLDAFDFQKGNLLDFLKMLGWAARLMSYKPFTGQGRGTRQFRGQRRKPRRRGGYRR